MAIPLQSWVELIVYRGYSRKRVVNHPSWDLNPHQPTVLGIWELNFKRSFGSYLYGNATNKKGGWRPTFFQEMLLKHFPREGSGGITTPRLSFVIDDFVFWLEKSWLSLEMPFQQASLETDRLQILSVEFTLWWSCLLFDSISSAKHKFKSCTPTLPKK